MPQLTLLKAASTLHDVAALLQFKASALAYILYKKPAVAKYVSFDVPKRGGGVRKINAPSPELLLLQRHLSDLLQNCVEEINQVRNRKDELAHGFKRHRSIITNATKHQRRRYVFNIDLQDFFPSINFGRVRGFFIKDANFMLHTKVATILAQIACYHHGLPQGAPCSPVISNLVGHVLDIRLCKLASASGCTYSRYADDITFSTNKPNFPSSLARRAADKAHKWEVGDKLEQAVISAGFAINPVKTRMQYRSSRQSVTGLVVNRKVNTRAEYRRTVRAMAHRLFKTGSFQRMRMVSGANGVPAPTMVDGTMTQLHGMFGHIDAVDLHHFKIEGKVESRKQQAKAALRSKEKLYRRFLMFKDFYAAPAPVVVCEGKTDNIYLLHAIRSLAVKYPKLATVLPGNQIKLNIRILKTAQTSTGRVLQLEGGASFLEAFVKAYCDEIKKFNAPGMQCAVVLVVDNDPEGEKICVAIKKVTKKSVSKTDPYVHIAGNLYMVLTPLKAGANKSTIEDCFSEEIKKLSLGGKTFNPDNHADSSVYFGKHILSQYVRENASKIDFTGFAGLLDRIAAAIEAHQSQQAVVAQAVNAVAVP
jgi:retron-type reverse transcriptase